MLDDLIAKLESASEGSREIDFWASYNAGQLDDVLLKRPSRIEGGDREFVVYGPDGKRYGWVGYHCVDPITQTVDAALALFERKMPGWEISVAQRKPRPYETCSVWWNASLFRLRTPGVHQTSGTITAKAATPALAICAALLRASAAEGAG